MEDENNQIINMSLIQKICNNASQDTGIQIDSSKLVSSLVQQDGILISLEESRYTFIHRTFQEYLVSSALAWRLMHLHTRQSTRGFIWQKRYSGQWREILRLLVSNLTSEYSVDGDDEAYNWIQSLLKQQQMAGGDPGNIILGLA